MSAVQRILKERRHYNKWVANQTLEDYALRFTAVAGRQMSIRRVGMTALGATSFLALEGLAAAVTLSYGFANTLWAILAVCAVLFVTGFPIAYHCARQGLDIDLLTRGAGFGYLGSTITSLIYASFTFIFFAIEAAILASALKALLGIPLFIGYILCAVAVIPIVTHGITAISQFQMSTQFIWLLLQASAVAVVIGYESDQLLDWAGYQVPGLPQSGHFDLALFGAAVSVLIALAAQIGEQADYLRFMPPKTRHNRRSWWFWLVLSGPGWVLMGLIKMLLGSFLAYLAITQLLPYEQAIDPTYMYQRVFQDLIQSPGLSLILAAVMVILCQMKINVTNAYAGSIAWSNFFSRLTHSHPGRVVWLVFNVAIALLLMELGIYQALEAILGSFAILALAWLGSLSADLLVNRPLGLSPQTIEFKRAHLYDINPVGVGSMLISTLVGFIAYLGVFGEPASHLCHFVTLLSCFICVPLIAWLTGGRYYLARQSEPPIPPYDGHSALIHPGRRGTVTCGICENRFEQPDMAYCPAYQLPICSLCCSLDVRCLDACKPRAGVGRHIIRGLYRYLPGWLMRGLYSRLVRFSLLVAVVNLLLAGILLLIFDQMAGHSYAADEVLRQALVTLFIVLFIISGVIAWLFLLAHESRVTAQKESNRQTAKLTDEIDAHEQTDRELQQAKEQAERANEAKSRYLTGISHELRTPLQSILGYAQLLADTPDLPPRQARGLRIIHRSGQYLTDLIEGLLDISKIEAGRLDLFRNQVCLPELVEQLVEMFRIQAEQKSLTLNFRVTGHLPQQVMVDQKRLRQILINLLSNAVKYTDRGQVDFEISYRNQVAEFTVRDTGPGIDAANLERIFQPFERVRDSATAQIAGTGLGLTIARLLTDIMGGDLQVDSRPGQGTEFRVSLLLPWVSSGRDDDTEGLRVVGYAGLQRTLLLADDDPVLRGLLADLLVPLGFTVIEARDGMDALALLESCHPDLFLLDIAMPGINGLELAQTLRSQGVSAPVIMLSANVEDDQQSGHYSDCYDDYLVKPVSNTVLLDRIGQQLNLRWVYCPSSESDVRSVPVAPQAGTGAHRLPNQHALLIELKAYAEMGYQKGVSACLQQIADADLLTEQALSALQGLSDTFQFETLAKRIAAGQI